MHMLKAALASLNLRLVRVALLVVSVVAPLVASSGFARADALPSGTPDASTTDFASTLNTSFGQGTGDVIAILKVLIPAVVLLIVLAMSWRIILGWFLWFMRKLAHRG